MARGRASLLTPLAVILAAWPGMASPVAAQATTPAAAQPAAAHRKVDPKWFRDLAWYEPLRAEPHSAEVQLLLPAWSDAFQHSESPGRRFAWQITLGREVPIVALSSQVTDGRMDAGQWGIGLWAPVSFHMIEDFADESNPIVDTDYRFGVMIKFQYGMSESMRLGLRLVPWAHESTHLGDEYVLIAQRPHVQPPFERVNVSYEYVEYGVSLEGEGLWLEGDAWVVRHGGINPWGSDGYYSDRLLGRADRTLTPSHRNFEPSFGVEYLLPEWRSRQTYFSLDVRHKLVYNYHQTPDNPERRQWSFSLQAGRSKEPNARTVLRDYFFEIYRGVNPYGQLRSQSDYWSAGFGWVFGF